MKSSPLTVENKVSYLCHHLNYYKIFFKFYHNLDHYIYYLFILIFPTIQSIQSALAIVVLTVWQSAVYLECQRSSVSFVLLWEICKVNKRVWIVQADSRWLYPRTVKHTLYREMGNNNFWTISINCHQFQLEGLHINCEIHTTQGDNKNQIKK